MELEQAKACSCLGHIHGSLFVVWLAGEEREQVAGACIPATSRPLFIACRLCRRQLQATFQLKPLWLAKLAREQPTSSSWTKRKPGRASERSSCHPSKQVAKKLAWSSSAATELARICWTRVARSLWPPATGLVLLSLSLSSSQLRAWTENQSVNLHKWMQFIQLLARFSWFGSRWAALRAVALERMPQRVTLSLARLAPAAREPDDSHARQAELGGIELAPRPAQARASFPIRRTITRQHLSHN